jgi:hypothetical protein
MPIDLAVVIAVLALLFSIAQWTTLSGILVKLRLIVRLATRQV